MRVPPCSNSLVERRRLKRPQYGAVHKRARQEWLAAYRPGQLCVRCGHPTFYPADQIDLDHSDDGTRYLGFSHHSPCRTCGARCNQASGGIKGGVLRRARSDAEAAKGASKGRKW